MIVIFITYQKIHYRNAEIERDFLFFSTLPFHLDFSPSKINQSFLFMLLDTTTKQGSPFSKMSKVQQTSIDNVDMLPSHTAQNSQNKQTNISDHETKIFELKVGVKSGLDFFILKSYQPLQSCCCPVQKDLPRRAELAWQVSRYL